MLEAHRLVDRLCALAARQSRRDPTALARRWGVAHRTRMLQHAVRREGLFQNPEPTRLGGFGLMIKLLPKLLLDREGRVPSPPLGPFHTDAAVYAQPPATGLRITWFGHSSLLLELDGFRILVDPIWDRRASPFRRLGPKRFFPPTLALEALPALDAIVISHDHYDHLGRDTVQALARLPAAAGARWVTSLAVGPILQGFGVAGSAIDELDWTDAATLRRADPGGTKGEMLTVTALPARHFSGRTLRNRFRTLWSSFALRGPRHALYFGADSGYWNGFAEIGRSYGPFDLTMLDTGAYNEQWKDIHMGPDGAVRTFQAMGAQGLLMPIHWGLFNLALHRWRWPIERITEAAQQAGLPLWSPVPGVPTEVQPGVPLHSRWWVRR